MLRSGIILAACAALAACANSSQNYQQTVYDAELAYGAALGALVAYEHLPDCLANGPKLCKDPQIVQQANAAQAVALAALQTAEALARDPKAPQATIQAAIAQEQAAVDALTKILDATKASA
jgi:Xaa-Pro aminopeptidase